MNYFKYIVVGVFSVLCFFTLLSGISHSDSPSVQFSRHDLSIFGTGVFKFQTFQVCVFCHTPHGANTGVRDNTWIKGNDPTANYVNTTDGTGYPLLLWNRALSDAPGENMGYETYTSSTMDANVGNIRVYSLLCLSCHDGVGAMNVLTHMPMEATVVLDSAGNLETWPNPGKENQMGDLSFSAGTLNPNIGNRITPDNTLAYTGDNAVQLRNDHPISFDYDAMLLAKDTGLNTQEYAISKGIRFFRNPAGAFDSVECPSCHNPHNQGGDHTSDKFPFLVMSNAGSALCLACHNK